MMSVNEGEFAVDHAPLDIPVRCSHFNASKSHRALTYRFNRDVLYLEAEHRFHAGSLVFIRIEECSPAAFEGKETENLKTVSMAQVVSCREIPEADPARYAITVRYCNPFGY